jgi:hypothetical protein
VIKINIICIFLFVLTLLHVGITVTLADVGGNWKIIGLDANSMALTQVGNHVYGTYNTLQGRGTIDGVVDAQNIWVGMWKEPFDDEEGCFSATFSNDTSHLVGSWIYGNPDCDVSPDYERNWHYNYYCPCYYRSGGDGYFQGEKVVTGNTTTSAYPI